MTFEEVLPLLRAGKKATRRFWLDLDGRVGEYLVVREMPGYARPQLVLGKPGGYMAWAGAQNDILNDDWELAE